jgi:tRNA(fMet)-specific endonuclease VapC
MSVYILDTDTISLYERGNAVLASKIRSTPLSGLAVTVITVHEQLSGWYTLLRRARQRAELARAYHWLASSVQMLAALPILTFTEPAIDRYDQLVALKLNIGRMDLRIAAITLEVGGMLVSRNLRDFQRVPGLVVEDWTA